MQDKWYDFGDVQYVKLPSSVRKMYRHWCSKCGCDRGYSFRNKVLRDPLCHACAMARPEVIAKIKTSHQHRTDESYQKQKDTLLATRVKKSSCSSVEEYRTLIHIRKNLRCRFNKAFEGNYKTGSAVKDLGCSIAELKNYLQGMWLPGMTWENYGMGGWCIDHIKPLCAFDLRDIQQVRIACHFTNLQPLWEHDNLEKRKYDGTFG